MVEVALVDVALKFPKVGVEVAVSTPSELVERRELIDAPVSVICVVEIEVVASRLVRVRFPLKSALPEIDSCVLGVVEPIPTLLFKVSMFRILVPAEF